MAEEVQERHEKLGPVALKILGCYVAIMLFSWLVGSMF